MHLNRDYADFKFFYAVGAAIHKGTNPYLGVPDISDTGAVLNFPYLPNIFPFLTPLGLMNIDTAFIAFRIAGIISIFFLCLGVIRLIKDYSFLAKTAIILCLSLFGLTFDVYLGNISTISVACIIWFIVALKENRQYQASIFLAISTIKPTLAFFLFLYILFKKRLSIFFFSLILLMILMMCGLIIAKINPLNLSDVYTNFFQPWQNAIKTNIDDNPFGSEYLSISRIDIGVIGARITKNKELSTIASGISIFLKSILATFVAWRIYLFGKVINTNNLVESKDSKDLENAIFLRDISLIALLTISLNYAQNTNNSILILPTLFLLVYKLYSYKVLDFKNKFIWNLSLFFLIVHTSLSYYLFSYLFGYSENYIRSITIGLLPNISIIGLIFSIGLIKMPLPQLETICLTPLNDE